MVIELSGLFEVEEIGKCVIAQNGDTKQLLGNLELGLMCRSC